MKIVCCDNVLGILGIKKSNCSQSIVCLHPSKQVCLMLGGYRVTDVEKWMVTGMVGRKPTWNVK